MNINTHALKLCDFGSAKALVAGEPNIRWGGLAAHVPGAGQRGSWRALVAAAR